MKNLLASLFGGKTERTSSVYEGFSDFFLRAPVDEKKKVITEAAHKANEDQRRVLQESRLKVETN